MSISQTIFRSVSTRYNLASMKCFSTFKGDTIDLVYTSYDTHSRGSQCPLMVLHGLLSSKNSWVNVSEGIHKITGRKVINVDARNHGRSPHSSQHTYIHLAYDTKKLIQTLDLPEVSLLCHSMGGRTGMTLSLLYPELISSLVVVDITPIAISKTLTSTFPPILEFATTIDFKEMTSIDAAKAFAKDKFLAFGVTQMDTIDIILDNIGVKPDRTIGWTCNINVLNEYFQTLTRFPFIPGKLYTSPVLFIAAEQSDFIQKNDLEGIKGYFPQAQMKYIPGVGHNIQGENPTMLIKLASEFLINNNNKI